MSWLLVHADTIDPKLDDLLGSGDEGGLGLASPHLLPPAADGAGVGASDAAAAADRGLLEAAPAIDAALNATHPPEGGTHIQGWPVVRQGANSDGVREGAGPGDRAAPAAAALVAVAATAAGAGGGTGRRVGDAGAAGAGASLQGSSLVPSDPVLAMQMGARLALTGERRSRRSILMVFYCAG